MKIQPFSLSRFLHPPTLFPIARDLVFLGFNVVGQMLA